MIKKYILLILFSVLFFIPALLQAQNGVLAIKGGDIYTVSGDIIRNGIIIIKDGKIQSVGTNIQVPPGAKVLDAEGMIITPGLIDARCSIGVNYTNYRNRRNLIWTELKIIEGFTLPENSNWLKGGVTAVYLTPGSQNLIGGFGAVVKLAGSKEEVVVKEIAGMGASIGESAIYGSRGRPTTRHGMTGILRQKFVEAREYKTSKESKNPELEAFLKVLNGEVPFRMLANTPDDIMTALRLAKEFNLKLVIDTGAGAHLVARHLAKAEVPVVVGPSMMGLGGGGPYEMFAHTPENAGKLFNAGVKVALSTESPSGRSVALEGVVAKSHGLPEDEALKAVTLNAAEILGVADRLGSIEPGKDADIVIWKNHPLSTWGESQKVIVNGKIVFER